MDEEWSVCLQTLDGHSGFVQSARFSPDDRQIASASDDKTIKIWDASTGQHQMTLEGHVGPVKSVAFSNDAKRLASASDRNVKIWDTTTGRCLWTIESYFDSFSLDLSSATLPSAIAPSPDTVKLMQGVVQGARGFFRNVLLDDQDLVWSVTFFKSKLRLATADAKIAQTWDPTTGRCLQTFNGHKDRIDSLSFSPDGSRIASVSWDQTLKVWSTDTGNCQLTLDGHSGLATSIAFSPDGSYVASASNDDNVKLWHIDSGKQMWMKSIHGRSLNFSSDGKYLALTSNKTVKVVDTVNGDIWRDLEGHSGDVSSAVFSLDTARVVSTSHDKTVKIWDIATGGYRWRPRRDRYSHRSFITKMAFSPGGRKLASASNDNTIKIWDTMTGSPLQPLQGSGTYVDLLVFSPDGSQLAFVSGDESIEVFTVVTTVPRTLKAHRGHVHLVAFSHDSSQLASASKDQTVKIWDVSTGKCLHTFERCNGSLATLIVFSRDKTRLALASRDNNITFLEVASNRHQRTKTLYPGPITSIGFSLDGYQLMSSSEDKTVKVLDVATGQCQIEENFSNGGLPGLMTWSPNKRQSTLTSAKGHCLRTLREHNGVVRSVALSSNGHRLVSASDDKTVKLWDVASGNCLQTLRSHDSCVYSVVFSEDERLLASASNDKTVKL